MGPRETGIKFSYIRTQLYFFSEGRWGLRETEEAEVQWSFIINANATRDYEHGGCVGRKGSMPRWKVPRGMGQ